MDPWLIVFGFGVGALVGATGMGGGSLMTPLLILLFGIKPVVAVGSDLAYAAITKTAGGWLHLRKGTVQTSLAWWLAAGSCPGAILGVVMLERLGLDDVLLPLISGALLLTGALVLLRSLVSSGANERDTVPLQARHKLAAVVLGAVVGFVLGLTSAGSGTLIAIGLILAFRLAPRRVVGTDVFHAAVLLWVAAIAHLFSGNVDLVLTGTILIGSLPGVWVGTQLGTRLPERGLRPALGVVILAAGLALLTKSGLDIPAAVIIGVPLVLGAIAFLVLRNSPPKSPLIARTESASTDHRRIRTDP
ncbi:MAG TPA: sulfite exporter TauE/SafE family protein [Solirubrobacter sp.]|nr:sulfite exporter TauE/SafE family protein [Solirubrobacter sp.]